MSQPKISDDRQGKKIRDNILETLKLISAFLPSWLLSYSRRYDFLKINIYMIQPRFCVLTAPYLFWATNLNIAD